MKLLRYSRRAEFPALSPSVSALGLWGHLPMRPALTRRPRRGRHLVRGGYTAVRIRRELKVRMKKKTNKKTLPQTPIPYRSQTWQTPQQITSELGGSLLKRTALPIPFPDVCIDVSTAFKLTRHNSTLYLNAQSKAIKLLWI